MTMEGSSTDAVFPVSGVRLGCASAGIKRPGRRDVVVMEIGEGAATAGIYTTNAFCAAPVQIARRHEARSAPRYFLINSGNANAGTGTAGLRAALDCCGALAGHANVEVEQVLPFSTGVIGQPLPVEKIVNAIPAALDDLREDGWLDAAMGIMTTDTRPKVVSRRLEWEGRHLTVTGMAKGAGMIRPDMATMLAYIATDAAVPVETLRDWLKQAADLSFNRITIDGDTSTNDCCMLAATGRAELSIPPRGPLADAFRDCLHQVFVALAQAVVKDGEGATKFVPVRVEGGHSADECLKVAYTVAESPLVKTALFASDPNWGRILAAVGRAGLEALDIGRVEILLGDVCIVRAGEPAGDYTEAAGAAVMAREEIPITIRLGRGGAVETIWTTDLSYDYVKINAEYRT